MERPSQVDTKVAIAGLGTIGYPVAKAVHHDIGGLTLTAVSSGGVSKAKDKLEAAGIDVPVVANAELVNYAVVVVDCAPTPAFREVAESTLAAGKLLVTVSGAALLDSPDLIDLAEKSGGQIHLVTGALLGLDAVRAASEGEIYSVRMITRKPPPSLAGAPYLEENGISIDSLGEPLRVFTGTARQGAKGFPANLNVAAALALAGVGPDRTELEIWADPTVSRNTHTIEVDADTVRLSMTIENVPSEDKPGTGRVTPLSVITALRSLTSPLRVGT